MTPLLLADGALEQMDPAMRAKVLMLITGLVILGGAMIVFVSMGARWARRLARKKVATPRPPVEDKWYARPLIEPLSKEQDSEEQEDASS